MNRFKQVSLFILRLVLTFLAMFVAYMVGTMVIGSVEVPMTPEQESQAAAGLIRLSAAYALLFSFLVIRARWYGVKLIVGLFLLFFGVESFMAQIETLYFNSAVQMEMELIVGIVLAGAVRAAIFAVLVVLIYNKWRRPPGSAEDAQPAMPSQWIWRILALAAFYVIVYFVFGYFVAWQWEETRLYYSGSTAIKPFFTHLRDLFVAEDPLILPFQLLRGALWALLALLTVRMIAVQRWVAAPAVGLVFAVLLALPLASFPNPYMPPAVAQSHFYEIFSSMFLFGGVAGWVLSE